MQDDLISLTPKGFALLGDLAGATFASWKDYARTHSRGGADNLLRHGDFLYSFDAHPRRLQNGALQGRVYRQARGDAPRDIGGFKIGADGKVAALPDELRGVLPEEPTIEALAHDPFAVPGDIQ